MISLTGTSRTMIGVDLGARSVRAVQLVRSGRRYAIAAATRFAMPAQDAAGMRHLEDALRRQGFCGRRIVLAAPHALVHADLIDLPALAPGAPVEQLTRMEIMRMHQMRPDAFELACWSIQESRGAAAGGRGVSMLAMTCAHEPANQLLDAVECNALRVEALDLETCALGRAVRVSGAAPCTITLILSLGWGAARLFALRGAQPLYQRQLEHVGMGRLHQQLAELPGCDADITDYLLRREDPLSSRRDIAGAIARHVSALAEELRVSLAYLQRFGASGSGGSDGAPLHLCGQGAAMPGLVAALETASKLKIRTLAPADLADCPAALLALGADPEMTTAFGLALYGSEA